MSDLLSIGKIESVFTQTGRLTGYRLEIQHKGLHEYRLLHAPNQYVLQNKANTQLAAWEEKWQRATSKAAILQSRFQSKDSAETITRQAEKALEEARNLLVAATEKNNALDWKKLEDRRPFVFDRKDKFPNVQFGSSEVKPVYPIYIKLEAEPTLRQFPVWLTFWDKIIPGRRSRRQAEARSRFSAAHRLWATQVDKDNNANRATDIEFATSARLFDESKLAFEKQRGIANAQLYELKSKYEARDTASVVTVVELMLNQSEYPDWLANEYVAAYTSDNGLLVIDYTLPKPESLPGVTKATYIANRNELKTSFLSEGERSKLFDSVLYQIALRTVFELLNGDAAHVIDAIVFNGWLTWTNKATGLEETGCLLSLQTTRAEIAKIDFAKVDPKSCFRELKGISAAKLSGITRIAPIARINMDDPRFVASHEVVDYLDESVNLASIDWEEFEHLVRELFGREFSSDGGEVKITRASADGGVDAVAFDTDPIRGGKIIIQAKRYTNTVGVSAVRDLYGTMMNEGAMKGILVTTSDYGPDSYAFAKDKPITLLNGGNLLQLMEKHGIELKSILRRRGVCEKRHQDNWKRRSCFSRKSIKSIRSLWPYFSKPTDLLDYQGRIGTGERIGAAWLPQDKTTQPPPHGKLDDHPKF